MNIEEWIIQKNPVTNVTGFFLVHRKGLEPPTLGTGIRCSIHWATGASQLSYYSRVFPFCKEGNAKNSSPFFDRGIQQIGIYRADYTVGEGHCPSQRFWNKIAIAAGNSVYFPSGNPKMFHFWWEGHCPSPTINLYDKRKFEPSQNEKTPGCVASGCLLFIGVLRSGTGFPSVWK